MRVKYSVKSFKPIYNDDGTVAFTTPDKTFSRRFKTKSVAYLFYWTAKLVNLVRSRGTGRYYWTWRPCYIPLVSIDTDLGISYQDCGPWRSYQLTASGDTLAELLADAGIAEVDQDGGDLDNYALDDASNEVHDAAVATITHCYQAKIGTPG